MCRYFYNDIGQLKIYNRVVRSSFSLPHEERLTLLFVLERTIGWRKVWQGIAMAEFMNGVFRRENGRQTLVMRGTDLSSEQVTLAIGSLRKVGAIETIGAAPGLSYKINENWVHPDLPSEGRLAIWQLSERDYRYENETTGDTE